MNIKVAAEAIPIPAIADAASFMPMLLSLSSEIESIISPGVYFRLSTSTGTGSALFIFLFTAKWPSKSEEVHMNCPSTRTNLFLVRTLPSSQS